MDSEKAARMEQHLLKTQFPLECQDLPFDVLSSEELIVVNKCMAQQDLTNEEFTLLKATLQKYRAAIHEHKPTETINAAKKTVQIINTEQDLINILDDTQNQLLRVHLPYHGQVYELDFQILPVDDSRIVDYMQMNIDLFKDYSNEERNLFLQVQEGKKDLTPEEKAVVQNMTQKINAIAGEEKAKMVDGFLASQLRLPNSNQDYNKRLEFWKKFPFMEKWAIVQEVEDRLGLTEKSNEELFPAI